MHVSILTAGTLGLLVGPALGELVLVVDGLLWMVRLGFFYLSSHPPFLPLSVSQALVVPPQLAQQARRIQPRGRSSSWSGLELRSLSLKDLSVVLVSPLVGFSSGLERGRSGRPVEGLLQSPGGKNKQSDLECR